MLYPNPCYNKYCYKVNALSHTLDQYFPCFYPCEPMGKLKNEQPHAGHKWNGDVIVMLKLYLTTKET